ncbi:MAG: hypothetical protein Q7T05_04650 [Dehalococcoidia bacterium]|nr:hypothetical protein [Dehalococcoidia bacterium]
MKYLICAILLLAGTLSFSLTAVADTAGTISGQVVNMTPNGTSIGALQVTLTTYANGQVSADQKTGAVDASGKFSFAGLSLDATAAYGVSTHFQDADYQYVDLSSTSDYPDRISLTAAKPSVTVQIDVYDSTTSDADISISSGHVILEDSAGAIQVIEVWRFVNSGAKTYVGAPGSPRTTLKFTLPSGATSIAPGQGLLPVTVAGGIADTLPVLPGNTDVNFGYMIPYGGSTMTFTRKADYPVATFGLLVKDTGVKVASVSLTSSGPQDMGGTKFVMLNGTNVAKGADIDVSFSNLGGSSGGGSSGGSAFIWPIVAAVLALALVAAIAYPRLRKRNAAVPVTGNEAPSLDVAGLNDKKALLQELARLDDEFEAGRIKESDYRAQRSSAKSRLVELYGRNMGNG